MADGSSVTNDDQNSQPAKQEQRVVFGVILILFKSPLFDLMGQTISNGPNLSRCISVEEESLGYLTSKRPKPDTTDPQHTVRAAENSMVMTWLVNSMEEDISSNYMCYSTAKELWDSVMS